MQYNAFLHPSKNKDFKKGIKNNVLGPLVD
jgi:hypothetical protein